MTHVLRNDDLTISVDDAGAELISIHDKEKNREVLWQADPTYWKRHAPILFPNVGRHYQDCYHIGTQEYHTKQHGFARDTMFTCLEKGADFITHQLCADEKTKEIFPFDFELLVTHRLCGKKVTVSWKVLNHGDSAMYFTIGGHPAFRVPVLENTLQSDYYLTFQNQASLTYLLLDPASGTVFADQTETLSLEKGRCKIDSHMFDHDALIFDDGQIQKAGISLPDGTPYVKLECKGFPNFGIWSVPGAPFVCLEPWMGRCDDCGFTDDISHKKSINALQPAEIFEKSYSISIC